MWPRTLCRGRPEHPAGSLFPVALRGHARCLEGTQAAHRRAHLFRGPDLLGGKLEGARERRTVTPEYDTPRAHIDPPPAAALCRTRRKNASLPCDHVKCTNTLCHARTTWGPPHVDGDGAQEIREHFNLLGGSAVLRPGLATKPQLHIPFR